MVALYCQIWLIWSHSLLNFGSFWTKFGLVDFYRLATHGLTFLDQILLIQSTLIPYSLLNLDLLDQIFKLMTFSGIVLYYGNTYIVWRVHQLQ